LLEHFIPLRTLIVGNCFAHVGAFLYLCSCCVTQWTHTCLIPSCLFASVCIEPHNITSLHNHNITFECAGAARKWRQELAGMRGLNWRKDFLQVTNLQL
jgi:hypothetical protein